MHRRSLHAVLLLGLVSCGGDIIHPVDGTWVSVGERSAAYVLQLRQDGDLISGVACRISNGRRIFADVPVSGTYPRLQFDPPSPGGSAEFRITVKGPDALEGTVNPSGFLDGPHLAFTFMRASPEAYGECAGAPS